MRQDQFNYDENDEITDEQYYQEDEANTSFQRPVMEEEEVSDQPLTVEDIPDSFEEDNEYTVSSISDNFLKCECDIKNEGAKTVIRFDYRGETYKGIVLQRLNDDNYVFLVKPAGKGARKNAEKTMKKIYIPDAELV